MGALLHLVLETPGARSLELLLDATMEDEPEPVFLAPTYHEDDTNDSRVCFWKASDPTDEIFDFKPQPSKENFLFLSYNLDLADQIEEIREKMHGIEDLQVGRILLFIQSALLAEPNQPLIEWLDAAAHFSDVMLFVDRTNGCAAAIKTLQDRYASLRFPMETFVLAKKINPWARILDPTPRRISHVFDAEDLLEREDLHQNDRYLQRLANGDRARSIPNPFAIIT